MHAPLLMVLTLALMAPLPAVDAPSLLFPQNGSILYAPHPHFSWVSESGANLEDRHHLQIATDPDFADIACEDRLELVRRFVPAKPLPPRKYWWRVRRGDGAWPAPGSFEICTPEHAFTIQAGSDAEEVARVMERAAAETAAIVHFEPGEYHLAARDGGSVATVRNARDLTVLGHGAKLILNGTFLTLLDCERITITELEATGDKPGHTLVRVLKVGAETQTLVVRPEPGFDPDVPRFFGGQGFLNRVDPERRGRHLGGFVSTKTAKAQPVAELPGAFVIGPVEPSALRVQEPGALSIVTSYGLPFVNAKRTPELTFSGVTLVDFPGAFCGGSETPAKSYLSCRVVPRSPQDYQGGHSAVGDGRIGEWIEACEFQMLADDGPNVRTMRMKIAGADAEDAVILEHSWTNTDLRPGDTVAVVHPKTFATATTRVAGVSVSGRLPRLQLNTRLADLAKQTGIEDWAGTFFYRVDPCCEDFVYRRNRHIGGRGHGVKFNGRRGLIADNHFEDITGNAIEIGYNWQDAYEGFGASDVLIARNTILHCGWTPISSHSKTSLGGRYVIRDNRIDGVRDAAVSLRHCTDVRITGNDFHSATAPLKGAWILLEDVREAITASNRFDGGVLEMKNRER